MRPYGHTRRDTVTCKFGCCTFKGGKHKASRKAVDRARRKRERRIPIEIEI